MRKIFIAIVVAFVCSFPFSVCAQEGNAAEVDYNTFFSPGEIVCSDAGQLKGSEKLNKSSKSYDETMIGVFVRSENLQKDPSKPNMFSSPLRTSGICQVKYNAEGGAIKKGDPITSSSTPGVGMKATQSGMIIGIALEDANSSAGLIKIRVLIQYLKQ